MPRARLPPMMLRVIARCLGAPPRPADTAPVTTRAMSTAATVTGIRTVVDGNRIAISGSSPALARDVVLRIAPEHPDDLRQFLGLRHDWSHMALTAYLDGSRGRHVGHRVVDLCDRNDRVRGRYHHHGWSLDAG